MNALKPIAQEPEATHRSVIAVVSLSVLIFAVCLGVIAERVFELRTRRLPHAVTARSRPAIADEVSHVRTALFRKPAAGELIKAGQETSLQHYGWVDRGHGVVRIPIDVAIDLEVREAQP
jgi:hypothetical protein